MLHDNAQIQLVKPAFGSILWETIKNKNFNKCFLYTCHKFSVFVIHCEYSFVFN